MSADIKTPKPKEFTVNDNEFSEYAFVVQNIRARQEELNFWNMRAMQVQEEITKRCGIDSKENHVSFDNVFSTSKIFVTPKPKIITEANNIKK